MTEDEARDWVRARVDPAGYARMTKFVAGVVDENTRQNLISPATIDQVWARHVVDSLQLHQLGDGGRHWLDIGTGGGFPGMILAIAGVPRIDMVEPRRKRATFLTEWIDRLNLTNATALCAKVEQVQVSADVITARAVASIEKLLLAARHCGTSETRWLLPRGSIDQVELAAIATRYKLVFHVEQSLTHPDSTILVLTGVGQ
jgi:16S rRNA (guanine527-N7)-methyltransferase